MAPPRRVTIVDLAAETGLSVSSVSVALRGDPCVSERSRALVREAADRLGYRPDRRARGLREHRSHLVGVTFWLHQTFHSALVESLYAALADTPYDLVLSGTTPQRSVLDAVESLRHERCDAVLLISPDVDATALAGIASRVPTVLLGSDLAAPGAEVARADDAAGMSAVVEHLVEAEHRRVCFVDGGDAAMSVGRRHGYELAARSAGLDLDVLPGYPTEEAGVAAAHALLARSELPTAVVTHNDMMAIGLLLTLRAQGVRVPQDVSVVGYDDTRMSALTTIGLTTVSQEPEQLAAAAIRRAIARAEGDPPQEAPIVVTPRLVVRSTTAPPRV